jgi:alpha-1,3-rhamnosyl/mannosyltransferase
MANCRHIIAISEFCRREIIETLGIPPERVTCTHLGIRRSLGPLPRDQVQAVLHHLGLPANYLLYVGTIEPRKNLRTLLEAYTALPASLRNQSPLLLVGGWGWNAGDVAQFLGAAGRQRGIIHLGYLAEEHLAAVYNGARALVYPSLYEGFGLPPLEMMACGGAVLASTAGAVAEVVGGQAHLIAPEDVDAWRAALSRVVRDGDWWRSLRQGAMTVAQRYSWERCAAETLHIYQRVCGKVPEMPALRRAG